MKNPNGMKNRRILILALVLGAAVSCNTFTPDKFSDYVSEVTVLPTDNALRYTVKLDKKKDCSSQVYYRPAGETDWMLTDETMIFLLPDTEYEYMVLAGSDYFVASDIQTFKTGSLPPEVPIYTVDLDSGTPSKGYLMQWQATNPGWLTFCDMKGRVVWYEKFDQAVRHVYCDREKGKIALLTGFREGVSSQKFQRLCDKIIEIDMLGNRLLEWTASEENVPYPHHDIKIMPDGNLLIFNAVVKKFDLSSIGGEADTDVWGDGFTIITPSGEVKKKWDVFGAIDPVNDDYLDAVELSYDLLHGNSVAWDSKGDFYITLNRLNELWKIDGKTSQVLYRLGEHGNIELSGKYPEGGLHSAVPLEPDKVLCYNNGAGENPRSRAQVYKIDPGAKTAMFELDVVIDPEYSSADRSNVELLPDGQTLMFASTLARKCVFTDLSGRPLKVISRTGISYRSHYFEK